MLGMVDPVAASLARSSTGRSGPSAAVVAADGPPGLAPGPAVPGVAAGGLGADGLHAGVGYPHGHAVLGTLGHAGVSGAHAGPEAGLQALGALGAEEGSLGGVNPGEPEGIASESRRRGCKCPSGYLGCWTGTEAPDRPVPGRAGGRCEGVGRRLLWLTRVIRTVVFTNFRTRLSAVGLSFYQVSALESKV